MWNQRKENTVVIGGAILWVAPGILLSSNIKYGNCTVTICHSHTYNLDELCSKADIVVAALSRPEFKSPYGEKKVP